MMMVSVRVLLVAVLVCALVMPGEGTGWLPVNHAHIAVVASCLPGTNSSWDQTFTFQCPTNKAVSRVQSVHCDTADREGRVWRFECKSVPGLSAFQAHFWTPWVNDYGGVIDFTCPFNSLVTGFKNEHSNSHHDQRWKVRCSKHSGMTTYNRALTPYQNDWDAAMDYTTDTDVYLTGMHGFREDGKEDRCYRFDTCKVRLD